ncbi:Transcription factor Sp2 [Colletotrichum siamense]|uniref:Transcription factor Sp2 n=1 Tax=Colletotrichum siamense TaxID=690259 RepID=UPI0018733477|nr:Transcription factor Sp2 [Colletotrichum siamense]KAF5496801.1 Transcription factor Sp2 [Colletotrichum siamense]
MVSIDQSYNMLPKHLSSEHDDYILYPEPPQAVFTTAPMEMTIPANASYMFPTSMPMEASPVYENNFIYQGRTSPSLYEDGDFQLPSSNLSTTSAPSAASSNVGSPQSHHDQPAPVPEWAHPGIAVTPGIVPHDYYNTTGTEYSTYAGSGMEDFAAFDFVNTKPPGFVDPSLIHPDISRPMPMPGFDPNFHHPQYPASPALSASSQSMVRNGSQSPFMHSGFQQQFSPYATPADARRPSLHSFPSNYSDGNGYSGDESKEKQRCPHSECGKTFKDLKAHMLTHQNERPEKCPIVTCDYHVKGFARKYDKNRHTLTHYKGTMVCGFCPGSGSAAEKSFNRADVFKRHLTAVHGVEQTPPNSRKKSTAASSGKKLAGYPPDATGKCSTCSQTFSNAQDFYEHLDDCVLRIVQQEDPAEAINAKRLAEVENDKDVHQTLEKNHLPTQTQMPSTEEDEDEDMDDEDDEDSKHRFNSPTKRKGNPVNGVQKSRGLTHSRGGGPMPVKAKGRKNRRDYPSSWGFDKGQMTMKKRVMAVFDGPRRLAKDDMMLSTDHEVRIKLADGSNYVTDLDVQTLKRAEGFLGATDDEKGPWISDDPTEEQLREMQAVLESFEQ